MSLPDVFRLTLLANGLDFIASGLRELTADAGPTQSSMRCCTLRAELSSSSRTAASVRLATAWLSRRVLAGGAGSLASRSRRSSGGQRVEVPAARSAFARLEPERTTPLRTGPLIATVRRAAPARGGARGGGHARLPGVPAHAVGQVIHARARKTAR